MSKPRSDAVKSDTGSLALVAVVLLVVLIAVLLAAPMLRRTNVPRPFPGGAAPQPGSGQTTARYVAGQIAPVAAVQADFAALRTAIEAFRTREGRIPADSSELQQAWTQHYAPRPLPIDPYSGQAYGYSASDQEFTITSAGPNLRFSSSGQ